MSTTSTGLLNIDTVELVSTLRTAPLNGAPSSEDYNDSQREFLEDLASMTNTINEFVIPLLNFLNATDAEGNTLVLNGDTLFASSDTTNPLFSNSTDGSPLTVSQVLTRVNAVFQSQQTTITALNARVSALTTQLSTSNQDDIAKAIQGYSGQLQSFYNSLAGVQNSLSALETTSSGNTTSVASISTNLTAAQSAISALQTAVTSLSSSNTVVVSITAAYAQGGNAHSALPCPAGQPFAPGIYLGSNLPIAYLPFPKSVLLTVLPQCNLTERYKSSSTLTIDLVWMNASGNGSVTWRIIPHYIAPGSSVDAAAGPAVTVTAAAAGVAHGLVTTRLTVPGPALAFEQCVFELARLIADSGDTATDDAQLMMILISYQRTNG